MGGPDTDGAYHHVPLETVTFDGGVEQLTELRSFSATTVIDLVDELAEQIKAFRELLADAHAANPDGVIGELLAGIECRLSGKVLAS